MTQRPALTLVELILVLGMLVLVGVPAILSVSVYRQKQALNASADNVVSVLSRAHIYSREAKEQKLWGVRYKDTRSYEMISGSPQRIETESEYGLSSPTTFEGGYFDVWFLADTGETITPRNVVLTNPRGDRVTISVSKSGVIEVQ